MKNDFYQKINQNTNKTQQRISFFEVYAEHVLS